MKLLVVFCTCGIRGIERIELYVKHVTHLLEQRHDDFRVAVSGACNTEPCKRVLKAKFGDKISYNWTHRKLTVNVCFNQTVRLMERRFGPFDAHVYVDSGIDVAPYPTMLQDMDQRMQGRHPDPALTRKCAMVAVRADNDQGFEFVGMSGNHEGDWIVPVGKACNLHCQAFHRSIFDAYGNVLPDIFVGDTTESTFSFLCAAVNRRWLILGKPEVHHEHSMDGPSSGHQRGGWNDPSKLLLFPDRCPHMEYVCAAGKPFGLGYEECHIPRGNERQWWLIHDPSKFDKDGNALDERLLPFLRNNLYLQEHVFSYSAMESIFVP
jgi:hypothetical protein